MSAGDILFLIVVIGGTAALLRWFTKELQDIEKRSED